MYINANKRNRFLLMAILLLASAFVHAKSLYDPSRYDALAADNRAHKIGDVITVLITENSVASTSATTSTNKGADIEGSVSFPDDIGGRGSIGLSKEFEGGGVIERSGRLVATLTVEVVDLFANGDLLVQGQQDVVVNEEIQKIQIEGRVRSEDIAPNNTVISARIGNAKISYVGDGVLAEKQKPPFLLKLLSLFGLIL